VLNAHNIDSIDAAFMDLGLSSLQIDEADRGFSYSHDTALDMRMDTTQSTTAATILATYDARELTKIFREYGEERFASLIARRIVETREDQPLLTSLQLVRLVDDVIPKAHRATGNPAKRVFQALRIEVNGELDKLQRTLPKIALHLREHGRLVVESYHSLEDTTVKRFMNKGLTVDVPANMPVIPEDAQPFFKSLTRGAMKASKEEIEHNTRSSSVRLRAVELCRPIPNRWLNRLKDEAYGLEPRKGGR
ncbi:16S rRNA (cytosine(1402)-N(4))-methyltransferase, partial [Bifidobacteriaceae bacterium NR015]